MLFFRMYDWLGWARVCFFIMSWELLLREVRLPTSRMALFASFLFVGSVVYFADRSLSPLSIDLLAASALSLSK